MSRRGHTSTPRPRGKTNRSHFGWIYELLQTAQVELDDAIRMTRLDVASRIGDVVSECFEKEGWTRETLVELSTWLRQRGADFELCAPENLARMKRLHELEQRIVKSDWAEVLNPCLSAVPPEDLAEELFELMEPMEWREPDDDGVEDEDEDEDDAFEEIGPSGDDAANDDGPPTRTKRH